MGDPIEPEALGDRLLALREALGWTNMVEFVAESFRAAERLGPGYRGFDRSNYAGIEKGRLQLTQDATRAVLCNIFRISRDDLANYLDGKIDLQAVIEARDARERAAAEAAGQPPPAPLSTKLPVKYGSHPEWARLVREAKVLDPELTDKTFEEIATTPFFTGAIDELDAVLLAQVARAHQNWRRRSEMKR